MREILFRGKTKRNEWIYGDLITHGIDFDDAIKQHHTREVWDIIPETVGQFTGLTDKNGEKVFEGDILVFCKGATYPYQIEWDGMGWKLYRADGRRIKEAFECNEIHYVNISEIIGNIHDNKELLGE